MKKSTMLRKAKNIFENNSKPHFSIYYLLYPDTLGISKINKKKLDELREWIKELLNPYRTYEHWLFRNHPNKYKEIENKARKENRLIAGLFIPDWYYKQGYLDWLDWMIKIHQEHGD